MGATFNHSIVEFIARRIQCLIKHIQIHMLNTPIKYGDMESEIKCLIKHMMID